MFKKLIILFILILSSNLLAQTIVLSDEFDNGDSKWNTGWIDASTTSVTVSIDNTGKLSGANSYKIAVTNGGVEMWRVQRVSALPLKAGHQYTISFMAVADKDNAGINVLFEIAGDPYTKRIDDTVTVNTTPQTYSITMTATENVSDNFAKLMFGSARNNNTTIWIDAIVVTEMVDPTLITQWGLSKEYNVNWPILNTSSTAPGDASIGGAAVSGWKGLQGGFGQDVEISTTKAIIVKGQIEFVGADAGDAYTPIRYALTYQDSNTTLQYALTDSATWSHRGNHFGYEFTPRTGAGVMANGAGGGGTVWTVNNGNWASTYSNGGKPIIAVNQAPRNAQIIAGKYNVAISVQAINDTTNEVRWYMIETSNKYWYGGVVQGPATTKKFNSIIFGVNEVPFTEFKVIGMKVDKGDPIVIPEAPWQSYYVDQWGLSKEYNVNWPILNDSTTLVGDASIGGAAVSGWKGLQGGFGQDVEISTTKAIIVKGQIEFVGADAGDAYTPIRYALTYQDSNTTLQYALTDSATWSHRGNHFGYEFTPRTGAGVMANGAGGGGTVWTVNNGNWASTYSNGGKPIIAVNQAPRNAQIIAGSIM
ncbi:MAG: carbohydrate binding domain-containing protein [Ignavibacteriae bacterium]|nr:carbohydrate binding domain-containing protein [Ignavibacteriota bacterium]